MGVHGLWKVLQSSGKPIKPESLEGKVLAVDISLWLNQSVKGVRGKDGNAVPYAHLLTLFNRICKLLHYKIKPVFVFDGGVPALKRQTIQDRLKRRLKLANGSEKGAKVLAKFIASQLKTSPGKVEDLLVDTPVFSSGKFLPAFTDDFEIPAEDESATEVSNSEDSSEDAEFFVQTKLSKIESTDEVDIDSPDFKSMPLEIQHELLNQMKEKRKGWGRLDEFPKVSTSFSDYQMGQLVKKRKLQERIEQVEREMNETATFDDPDDDLPRTHQTKRVMSDESSRLIYVSKKGSTSVSKPSPSKSSSLGVSWLSGKTPADIFGQSSEFDYGKSEAMHEDKSTSRMRIFQRMDSSDVGRFMQRTVKNTLVNPHCVQYTQKAKSPKKATTPATSRMNSVTAKRHVASSNENILSTLDKFDTSSRNFSCTTVVLSEASDSSDDEPFTKLKKPTAVEPVEPNQEKFSDSGDCNHYDLHGLVEEEVTVLPFIRKPEATSANSITKDEFPLLAPVYVDSSDSESGVASNNTAIDAMQSTEPSSSTSTSSTANVEPVHVSASTSNANFTKIKEVSSAIKNSLSSTVALEPETFLTQAKEAAKAERQSTTVSETAVAECKDLLRLFGLPFIESPMEAEAQCAKLEELGLTQGTITDDSDIWLFGGQVVYKYFFTQSKSIELYTLDSIQKKRRFDQDTFICFALLVGSDYTDGVLGIGPVTAMEILDEFHGQGLSPLESYKHWWTANQKEKDNKKHPKYKLLQFSLNDCFPNRVIYNAYKNPTVDESNEKFTWGTPDLELLVQFAVKKLGFTKDKAEGILLPVMKRWNEKKLQPTIDKFLQVKRS